MTPEQLKDMSYRQINRAIAGKQGFAVVPDSKGFKSARDMKGYSKNAVCVKKAGYGLSIKDYCDKPDHYMPIAIEHRIDISFDLGRVSCSFAHDVLFRNSTRELAKSKTGRAVCEAFLMMEVGK